MKIYQLVSDIGGIGPAMNMQFTASHCFLESISSVCRMPMPALQLCETLGPHGGPPLIMIKRICMNISNQMTWIEYHELQMLTLILDLSSNNLPWSRPPCGHGWKSNSGRPTQLTTAPLQDNCPFAVFYSKPPTHWLFLTHLSNTKQVKNRWRLRGDYLHREESKK